MAKVWITEIRDMAFMGGGERIQAIALPPLVEHAFDFSTATLSPVFGSSTRGIRIRTDADAHIEVGLTPTATTDSLPLTAKAAEYFGVTPGHRLSIIAAV